MSVDDETGDSEVLVVLLGAGKKVSMCPCKRVREAARHSHITVVITHAGFAGGGGGGANCLFRILVAPEVTAICMSPSNTHNSICMML